MDTRQAPPPQEPEEGKAGRLRWSRAGAGEAVGWCLTCNTQDAAASGSAVVLGQGALRAGTEQEAAIGAGDQAGDSSLVTPAHTGMPAALAPSCTIPDHVPKGQQSGRFL